MNSTPTAPVRTCRICGCTDADCSACIRKQGGVPCHWVAADLCSACAPESAWLLRVKRGNTNVATCRVGLHTFRASSTSDERLAAQRLAERIARELGADGAVLERYTILSIHAARGSIRVRFVVPAPAEGGGK